MTTATIYARVPYSTKETIDDYAAERGFSLASAITELLDKGLEAVTSEASIQALEARAQELEQARVAAKAMNERLKQVLGQCTCGNDLTGRDLLVDGICPNCKHGVTGLLIDSYTNEEGRPVVNRNEIGPFIASVGVTLAILLIAYASSK